MRADASVKMSAVIAVETEDLVSKREVMFLQPPVNRTAYMSHLIEDLELVLGGQVSVPAKF